MTEEEIRLMQARARELGDELRKTIAQAEVANKQLLKDVRISPEAANAPCTV